MTLAVIGAVIPRHQVAVAADGVFAFCERSVFSAVGSTVSKVAFIGNKIEDMVAYRDAFFYVIIIKNGEVLLPSGFNDSGGKPVKIPY